MVGLFYIYLPMSWQIPTQIEQDIIAGKAKYQTFQTGNGGQSILQVPPNSYAVIFGYDFSPAGGGFKFQSAVLSVNSLSGGVLILQICVFLKLSKLVSIPVLIFILLFITLIVNHNFYP